MILNSSTDCLLETPHFHEQNLLIIGVEQAAIDRIRGVYLGALIGPEMSNLSQICAV